MSRFGLGDNYGIALTRRAPGSPWQPAQSVSHGTYSTHARIGAADDGELILAWVEGGQAGLRSAIIPR